MITDHQQMLLNCGVSRHSEIALLHRDGQYTANQLRGLIGLRCKKLGFEYEITDIGYGWDGYITARGKRMLTSGKLSQYVKDIGPITPKAFE